MARKVQVSHIRIVICLLFLGLFSANQESAKAAAPDLLRLGETSPRRTVSYLLKPGDEIKMTVYREDDLSSTTKLDKDGSVVFPLIGEVNVGGMTIKAARALITGLYEKDYLVKPQVNLMYTPKELEAGRFTVLGRVTTPGAITMPKGVEKIQLLEAIAMAGGFTRYANRNSVRVKRREATGEKVYKIDAKKLAEEPETLPFFILPGDNIEVPERVF
jgi:polysaccharide biosynthesis/export protein